MDPSKDWYTPRELIDAPWWPISKSGTYAAVQSGQLPSIRVGAKILIPARALAERMGVA